MIDIQELHKDIGKAKSALSIAHDNFVDGDHSEENIYLLDIVADYLQKMDDILNESHES